MLASNQNNIKIAIVCGHFIPTLGYIEVHLANAFHKLGYKLKVFTSDIVPGYVKTIGNISTNTPYEVERLPASFSKGQMVKSDGLITSVTDFDPSLVICIGVGKLFPSPIYDIKNRSFKLVTLLGDNEETYFAKSGLQRVKNKIIQRLFKKRVYVKAIKKSDVLLPYTPSTIAVVTQFVSKSVAGELIQKSRQISLGFDADMFFYDNNERTELRKELGIADDELLLVTATRVVPEKQLEYVIDVVAELNEKGKRLKYLIVGFQEDEYGKSLKEYIAEKSNKEMVICRPFAAYQQIRKYYNGADMAIFNRAAISIFEALATGLCLLLPNRQNVSHILDASNGVYFSDLTPELMEQCMALTKEERSERVKSGAKFAYENLAKEIMIYSEL